MANLSVWWDNLLSCFSWFSTSRLSIIVYLISDWLIGLEAYSQWIVTGFVNVSMIYWSDGLWWAITLVELLEQCSWKVVRGGNHGLYCFLWDISTGCGYMTDYVNIGPVLLNYKETSYHHWVITVIKEPVPTMLSSSSVFPGFTGTDNRKN